MGMSAVLLVTGGLLSLKSPFLADFSGIGLFFDVFAINASARVTLFCFPALDNL
jgi:hypothetical protein